MPHRDAGRGADAQQPQSGGGLAAHDSFRSCPATALSQQPVTAPRRNGLQ
ncbi:hypothetical protein A176_000350 [Myxococcus hansupus]|uniref:Uncharacterized protein n=1 Tax=Pseudomyxococcus hansupus TaxID=1297742 RepID=A0A0H4WPF2_9BACT|nr:hypothetical protein A176_000350 [Myxococcus hansupus]